MEERWAVRLGSCVDASPLLVWQEGAEDRWRCVIGSHAHNVMCIGSGGGVEWETRVGGRVEGSAALTADGSQVVVGCYDGGVYFLALSSGAVSWKFTTLGEVKCQPAIDPWNGYVWCGSHDKTLYVLDAQSQRATWQCPCGGSIFGTVAFDQGRRRAYVGTTGGAITAIHVSEAVLETLPSPTVVWSVSVEPVFASLAVVGPSGNDRMADLLDGRADVAEGEMVAVLYAAVDGSVGALSHQGTSMWKVRLGGPLFATPCLELPGRVLVACRDGKLYCLDALKGRTDWVFDAKEPFTASPSVEVFLGDVRESTSHELKNSGERMQRISVCTASGVLIILRCHLPQFNCDERDARVDAESGLVGADTQASCGENQVGKDIEGFCVSRFGSEVGRFRLGGDVFSSPVFVDGEVVVGCRDDFLHCFQVP